MSLRSPVGRVLGLGTAKDGVGHWWMQRVTSIALVVLALWFVSALIRMGGFANYAVVTTWIGQPLNSVLLILLIGTVVYHSQLGVQVVVEDYVGGGLKIVTMLLINFIHVGLAAAGIFAVLKIAFGTSA